jgi:hypothetical protein
MWRMVLIGWLVAALSSLTVACGDDGGKSKGDPDGGDTDSDTGTDTGSDTGPDPAADCDVLGLPIQPFVDAEPDTALYATAADFTVPTTDGDWTLSERWSGCDSYLLLSDRPNQVSSGFGYGPWTAGQQQTDVDKLFDLLPRNTHLFLMSEESDQAAIDAALEGIEGYVDASLAAMSDEDRAWWERRVHYVTARAADVEGWVGQLMVSPGWGIGIDRFQRIRYVGSYSDPSRYNDSVGWFGPNISMVANEAVYYNYEAEREAELEADGATVVSLFPGDAVSGTVTTDVTLPDAETMAGFDTMVFDLYLGCDGSGEFGTCPEWDYLVYLHLCDEADPDTCEVEIGRWITTYHREGRWVHDVSGLLPLIASGGERRFSFYTQQTYELRLDIRLSNQGKEVVPSETIPLFSGNHTFDEVYNDNYSPIVLTVPSDAVVVELATVITGHGMSMPGNCAEFCNTDHHFYVNVFDNMRDFPMAGNQLGCMDQVADGTVPNQYGTWWYGRGGWCPGKHVDLVMIDVTDQVFLGEENTFDYEGFYMGMIYTNGDNWRNIRLDSWLVISR